MADVSITPSKRGPYLVKGANNINLVDTNGDPFEVSGDSFALCRCGHSKRKPFCDGAHRDAGFDDEVTAK